MGAGALLAAIAAALVSLEGSHASERADFRRDHYDFSRTAFGSPTIRNLPTHKVYWATQADIELRRLLDASSVSLIPCPLRPRRATAPSRRPTSGR
jgi:hypothetical protein